MSWQPIETAPKDGTTIDLWGSCANDGDRWVGRFTNVAWGPLYNGGEDWIWDGIGMSSASIEAHLTHWMPLPEPPEGTGA